MSTIVTRAGKGSQLSWTEVDSNFTNLNTDKLQSANSGTTGQVLTKTAGGAEWATASGGPTMALLTSTTGGISLAVGSNQIVDTNWTETLDTGSIVSVSGDDFTLVAGTYIVEISTGGHLRTTIPTSTTDSGELALWLYNVTGATNVKKSDHQRIIDENTAADRTVSLGTVNITTGFTIASSTTYRLRSTVTVQAIIVPDVGFVVNITKIA